jgi:two-component system, chemotaxis family, sensor kinase Cph1
MTQVTLDNCDQEPIHTPGSIQPNGVLLGFALNGDLLYLTENAASVLGTMPSNHALNSAHLDAIPGAAAFILHYLEEARNGQAILISHELHAIDHKVYDLVIHMYAEIIIAEFEIRSQADDDTTSFSVKVQKALNVIRQQKTIQSVLQAAAKEVRLLTGFDRVMSYVFHQDDSGHIVAEAKREDLDALVNRHYPASDIPPQARRLYIENTLRLISDVASTPIPLLSIGNRPLLDMSHCILRSVSPIHIEYLQNMGVGASMSISIVVNGRLWGLIACHHMSAKQVPYSIRMACDVLCQILGSTVNQLETKVAAEQKVLTSAERAQLSLKLINSEDYVQDLLASADSLKNIIHADGLLISFNGKVNATGVSHELTTELVNWIETLSEDYFQFSAIQDAPDFFSTAGNGLTGALGFCIDRSHRSWIIYLRMEKVHTINWSGFPEKEYKVGPLGARLTPRGSFDEWKQTVKGQCEAWTPSDIEVAKDLQLDLMRVSNTKSAENNRIRTQLMAILGHDLRDPLNSISMANQFMEHQEGASKMRARIKSSTGRMNRLITDVMDMAKLDGGIGLRVSLVETNLTSLLSEIIEENRVGYPNSEIIPDISEITTHVDPDRISQVIANLISNARHHGEVGTPVKITLQQHERVITLAVKNKGKEIEPELTRILFDPFKRLSKQNDRNKTGMGLGLYISHEIIKAHNGEIIYHYDSELGEVVFTVKFATPSS